ncbi:Acyl-CoA thioesterase I precursor [Comamonas aquatica]|uniref:GDSL-type esterase/lipase family protein n=1 Tax=Comamonas aquatica TaxID=225991 RepID=UPI001EF19F46|nr:GDSL-type esterase/lipase family protein [Comamonas aquatica]CAC9170624.1 Acyl-CoA thioesterase I precursor [Comamonas aquatica]
MIPRRTALLALLSTSVLLACGAKTPRWRPCRPVPACWPWGFADRRRRCPPGEDWPSLLAERTGWEVTNGGVSGDTSAQGLARLPALLQEHAPRLVIVGLGGNDFLRRAAPGTTREALAQIVRSIQAANAQAVLVAIPQPSLMAAAGATPSDHPLYQELAQELKVPLIANLWGPILGDASLRADQVHANAQGYAAFAQALEQALRRQGLLAH